MKPNLTLIQPIEYNNLFSSYHNDTKTRKHKNYNLPKITKLFTTTNSKQNKTFNELKLKLRMNKLSNVINDSKCSVYPLLNTSINNRTMTKTSTHLDSINYNLDNPKNKIRLIEKMKNNTDRKGNIHQLKMVYLNLFNFKSNNQNNSIINFDTFFNSIDNFELEKSEDDKKLSQKLKEINNQSIIKIKNIFKETNFDILNNDISTMKNIQESSLNQFVEKLLNKYKDKNNISKDENSSFNSLSKSLETSNFKTNNVFFDWILDNVKHKIELKNEYNQHLTNVWIQNLINDEINELKNRFIDFRKSLNLSNYLETQRKNRSINSKIFKTDDSYFTTSTYRTNLNQSKRKSSINNNSNIISNYNSSYENDESRKINLNFNYTLNEMNAGFDFFNANLKKARTIRPINPKKVTNVFFNKNFKFNANNIWNLNKIHLKNTLIKSKNKTELDNQYNGGNSQLIKNLYINQPRGSQVRNFKSNIPDDIKSKVQSINNEFNSNRISQDKKNFDIYEKINNKANKSSMIDSSDTDSENSFKSIEKVLKKNKRRYSAHFLPPYFTPVGISKINMSFNNISFLKNNKNDIGTITPQKELNKKRGSDFVINPKFNDNIAYKSIVKSIYKKGKYKPKLQKNNVSSSDSDYSSSFSDDDIDSSEIEENDEDVQNNINKHNNNNINNKRKNKSKNKKKIKKSKKHKKENKEYKEKNNKKSNKGSKGKNKKTNKINMENEIINRKESIIEPKKQEFFDIIEKNELIKELNKSLLFTKRKKSLLSEEEINQFKKIFAKKTKTKSKKKKDKKEKDKNDDKDKSDKKDNKNDNEKTVKEKKQKEKKFPVKRNSIKKRMSIKEKGDRVEQEGEIDAEKEEEREPSIYSISSNENEDDDMNENLQIKNEVDIMNLFISNKDAKDIFNSMFILKKNLRKKDKTEEDKKEIKEHQAKTKEIIEKYFDNLISKLSNNNIKQENIHLKVLNELQLVQKYGVFTKKDLYKLTKRNLEERYDEGDYQKYNKFNYYDEYDEYFGTKKEKKYKLMKKSASAKLTVKKFKFKKVKHVLFDDIKTLMKKDKKELIYNNAYLFKDNHSDDDEGNNFIIKKEIEEILNKEYNEMIKAKKEEIIKERKKKAKQINMNKKVPFKKKVMKRKIVRLTDDSTDEALLNNSNKLVDIKELEKEKERDRKLYDFFSKIQKLKKRKDSYNQEMVNKFIDQQIDANIRLRQHQRLYYFLEEFNFNRMRAKHYSFTNNKKIGYISPIIFTSPNENSSLTNFVNSKGNLNNI